MKRKLSLVLLPLVVCIVLFACRKNNYLIGGGLSVPEVNLSTYDFLKNHSWGFFDTTCLIIDKAGMKDIINGNTTIFVPTDYSITNFLTAKRTEVRKIDERLDFTLDSLFKYYDPQMLRDSLGIYVLNRKLNRDEMNSAGKDYETIVNGVSLRVSLEESEEYIVPGITIQPKYVFLTQVRGQLDVNGRDPSGDIKLLDIKVSCQTSDVVTSNGIVHVLDNSHIWMFHQ